LATIAFWRREERTPDFSIYILCVTIIYVALIIDRLSIAYPVRHDQFFNRLLLSNGKPVRSTVQFSTKHTQIYKLRQLFSKNNEFDKNRIFNTTVCLITIVWSSLRVHLRHLRCIKNNVYQSVPAIMKGWS